jgi:hypothetical protein
MAEAALREERPVYGLRYNNMAVRYIRDARRGDIGYKPGQPTQVIVEVEVEKSHTPYEIRVPADQLKIPEEGSAPITRAWPPPAPPEHPVAEAKVAFAKVKGPEPKAPTAKEVKAAEAEAKAEAEEALQDFTVPELKEALDKAGVEHPAGALKADLIALCVENDITP